jgi:glyoxylase-like metal-dependent hydrolase (beta-lactamase superfamily II)
MKLHSIPTGNFKLDGGAMFGVVPKSIWQKLQPADELNLCSWAMRCLLIEDGNQLILIDNGIGDKQDAKFMGHYHLHGTDSLDQSLAQLGFNKEDITDVVLTHLHFDHCGGSVIRTGEHTYEPAFKRAHYWSNARHWEWATNPNEREKASFLKENILPIEASGQLKWVNGTEERVVQTDIHAKMQIRFMHGHTDAQMLPQIQYGDKTIVFMADLLPSVSHLPLPYVMAYDMFPLQTLTEKKLFLQEAVDNDYILFFEHDPVHECCTLTHTEKGIRVKETFKLNDW